MFLKINETGFINLNTVLKVEAGNNANEGHFIVLFHSINSNLSFTKISFGTDETKKLEFLAKIENILKDLNLLVCL